MKKKIGIVIIVLLVLAIIGIVGMMINNASISCLDYSMDNMSMQAKETFNNKFYAYEGFQIGLQVRDLINAVVTSNNKYCEVANKQIDLEIIDDKGSTRTLIFNNKDNPTVKDAQIFTTFAILVRGEINNGKKYVVLMTPDIKTGLISKIAIISENNTELIEQFKKEYDKQRLESENYQAELKKEQEQLEKQDQIEYFWTKNIGYIILLGICILLLIFIITIRVKAEKFKKKIQNNNM